MYWEFLQNCRNPPGTLDWGRGGAQLSTHSQRFRTTQSGKLLEKPVAQCLEVNISRILIPTFYHMGLYCPCEWGGKKRRPPHQSVSSNPAASFHPPPPGPSSLSSAALATLSLSFVKTAGKNGHLKLKSCL